MNLKSKSKRIVPAWVWPWRRHRRVLVQSAQLPELFPTWILGRQPTATPPAPATFPQIFFMESFFVRQLISVLTVDADEQLYFLTGPKIGPLRIVSRWAERVSPERQSPVFVRASAKSVAAVLIPIIEQGCQLHMIAHSHPGAGEGATHPSNIDIGCMDKLEKAGSPAIGCIVTRDGFVRFFSVSTIFHVTLTGAGVNQLAADLFYVTR